MQLDALFALAFASASPPGLTSLHKVSRKLIMQKACGHPEGLPHFVSPSRYLFTIGHRLVFSLGEWSPRIQSEFHVCRPTWDTPGLTSVVAYGPVTLFGRTFQIVQLTSMISYRGPATPDGKPSGLGFSAFVRHYLRNIG